MIMRGIVFLSLVMIVFVGCKAKSTYVLESKYLIRKVSVKDGKLSTIEIKNKRNNKTLIPESDAEFKLRLSKGTEVVDNDVFLSSKDFQVLSVDASCQSDTQKVVVELENKQHHLLVSVHYELAGNDSYIRKYLNITPQKDMVLERIDVEALGAKGASQPYQIKKITARAPAMWKPGLGQPLYETESATFWGMEFPAASNYVSEKELNCGYLWGNKVKEKQTYKSYKAVCGVAESSQYIDEAFYKYLDAIRVRPLRLQVQYNSWFDFGSKVTKESFERSCQKVHHELVERRGLKPLNAYVIDDGWQDSRKEADWSDKVWKINNKFSLHFEESKKTVEALNSSLGLWLSPGCFFGAHPIVSKLGEVGYESLELSMSMTGPKYMEKLEERILELTHNGIGYFKFDGLFGHLNIRDFELKGRGTPAMPQLGVDTLKANDELLNSTAYDELKTYYLVNGSERMITIFKKMAEINPEVFIAITNGAYLSPWWLQYIDVVWMINAGDAAGGSSRTAELVYRDGVYYDIWEKEHTKFPMNALFNHEPKKVKTGEDKDAFRDYFLMNISRGTGFIELYLKTEVLDSDDWDVLAEGLKWSYHVFPTFTKVRMHGGNPRKKEVYGYMAWNNEQGYVSMHNPSDHERDYTIKLDSQSGMTNAMDTFYLSSPVKDNTQGLQSICVFGDSLTICLKPREIRIINFDKQTVEWDKQLMMKAKH